MSTATASFSSTGAVDPDERIVEEVHCIECGVPISAIPSWYANVNVRFTCDTCRQKSPRLGQPAPASLNDGDGPRSTDGALGVDIDPDGTTDDVEIDDTDTEIDDTDTEAEAEEE